ncbi:toll/interleukin-1 receptor domain-containing protein [Lentzea californiensis]|uniref:toll/interleukin-1 receptor domain-containing protein n=1 Tax=Lentzea californiensis TaxID=438851 RepID=UPI0021647901|nr:toll/interleukin-1 receptor domain-containing protein [Lentzea californiensis]MCR3746301.1 TIR domain-containing protein [Lentzea californiensis]
MAPIGGFWSYAHADDTAESGRITQLARDVVAQYEMITGDSIDLFLDRDNLEWGDEWRPKIDATLSSVAFFIAILTPRYFQSKECRRELDFFARRATDLGVKDLVLPILYVDIAAFREDEPADPYISMARSFQWEDWTDLRFAAVDSPDYRRTVANLAARLADANSAAETAASTAVPNGTDTDDDDDAPGFVDLVAMAEEALPQWAANLTAIGEDITLITESMNKATAKIEEGNKQGRGMTARIAIFQELAEEIEPPTSDLEILGGQFSKFLQDVDRGVSALLEKIPEELSSNDVTASEVATFLQSMKYLADNSEEGLGLLEVMVQNVEPAEKNSRSLRRPLRNLRKALTLIADGRDVMRMWLKKIDAIKHDHPDVATLMEEPSPHD